MSIYLNVMNQNKCKTSSSDKVKGRQRSHVQFWEDIGAYDNILEIIKNGYIRIPFYSLPPKSCQKNNKSALLHNEFVENCRLMG
jgi:hypothetical protein